LQLKKVIAIAYFYTGNNIVDSSLRLYLNIFQNQQVIYFACCLGTRYSYSSSLFNSFLNNISYMVL